MLKGITACVHPGLASREGLALDAIFFEPFKDLEVSETTTPCEVQRVWEVKDNLPATLNTQRALGSSHEVTVFSSKKVHFAVRSLGINFRWNASTVKSTLDACACSPCEIHSQRNHGTHLSRLCAQLVMPQCLPCTRDDS